MTSYSEEYARSLSSQNPQHPLPLRTVPSYTASALTSSHSGVGGQLFEPLLLHDGGDAALRHAQRRAAALAAGISYPLDESGVAALETSYDLNNSNYVVNQGGGGGSGGGGGGPALSVNQLQSHPAVPSHPHAHPPPLHSFAGGHHGFGAPNEVLAHEQAYHFDDEYGHTPTGMAGAYPYLSSPFAVPPHLRSVIGGGGLEHSDSILLSPGETFAYSSTPLRWWVLAVFSLLGFMQSFIWLTYSPITNKTEDYYGISEGAVDLTLNWGPIIALPVTPWVMQWASNSAGVRRLVFISVWLELLACALRLIPELGGRGSALHAHALWFIHPAHILNAAAGPMIQASITKISCLWFPAAERTSATAVLIVSANVGSAAGFLIAPAMVTEAGDMPKLLLLQAGMTVLTFLAVFPLWPRLFFPARPDFFPSRAAAEMEMGVTEGQTGQQQQNQNHAGSGAGGAMLHESLLDGTDGELLAPSAAVVANPRDAPNASLWNGSKFAFSNRSFVLLALSNGLLSGVFNGWTGVLSTVMPSDDFSDSTCGWLSFTATMAGCVAGVAVGPLTARVPSLRRKLKALVLAFTLFAALCAGVFMLLTPSVFSSRALLSHMAGGKQGELALMFVAIALFGACIGASAPLTFELSVELTFPAWESISGGTLSFLINVGSLVFLAVAPALSGAWMTALMTLSVILCAAMLLPVREKYWRIDHEEGRNGSSGGGNDDAINGPVYIDGLSSRASVFTNGGGGSDGSRSVSQQRRGGGLAAHEADLHEEFARIMHQVDDGMAAPSASPPILA